MPLRGMRVLSRPFVCRRLSPRYTRLCRLALGGLRFTKTVINCFRLAHPVIRSIRKGTASAVPFLMELSRGCVLFSKTQPLRIYTARWKFQESRFATFGITLHFPSDCFLFQSDGGAFVINNMETIIYSIPLQAPRAALCSRRSAPM